MNGLFNLLAALLIGGAVVITGYALTRDSGSDGDESQIEQLADKTLAEAEEKFRQTAGAAEDMLSDAEGDGREDPYTADVADSAETARDVNEEEADIADTASSAPGDASGDATATGESPTRMAGNATADDNAASDAQSRNNGEKPVVRTPLRGGEADRTQADRSAMSEPKEDNQAREENRSATAGINTTDRKIGVDKKDSDTFYTDKSKPVDKPDSQRYYTETKPIDKPDTQRYYTENKRIDKPDTDRYFTENRRLDKPDSPNFYTENQTLPENRYTPLDNPCLREDGTIYTGPGTIDNPFADSNPCLVEQIPPVLVTELPPEQPLIPRVDLPETPVTPIVVAERCEYKPGQYTQDPYTDGVGYGWLSDVGCYGTFPWTGFGPQPSIPPGGSDYIM